MWGESVRGATEADRSADSSRGRHHSGTRRCGAGQVGVGPRAPARSLGVPQSPPLGPVLQIGGLGSSQAQRQG